MHPDVGFGQIVGARERQEDTVKVAADGQLYVMCDGIGGHQAGDIASTTAAERFISAFDESSSNNPSARLLAACEAANLAIRNAAEAKPELVGMGTTLIAVHCSGRRFHWISVGDSHLYLVSQVRFEKLNADHSMGAVLDDMASTGEISYRDAADDPNRNALRSALSGGDIAMIDCRSASFNGERSETLVIGSDGLDTLNSQAIGSAILAGATAADAVAKLLSEIEAAQAPHQDNASAIAIRPSPRKKLFGLF